jgi:hypothetical protein
MPWMMGGMNGFGLDYLYPWLNNSQHISDGFRDQYLNTQIGDLRTDVNRGFGDVQLGIAGVNQNICQTGNGITAAINASTMADMNRSFALQLFFRGIRKKLAGFILGQAGNGGAVCLYPHNDAVFVADRDRYAAGSGYRGYCSGCGNGHDFTQSRIGKIHNCKTLPIKYLKYHVHYTFFVCMVQCKVDFVFLTFLL